MAKINDDGIRDILVSCKSHKEMSRRYGVTHQYIMQIRFGACCQSIAPELPRWSKDITCDRCLHWLKESCGLGFPDPIEEGPGFARNCAAWMPL